MVCSKSRSTARECSTADREAESPTERAVAFRRARLRFAGLPSALDDEPPLIDLHSDAHFMGEALRQALRAYECGEVPVGAVIVRGGRVIARSFNQVEILKDATAHAEMLAITQAENAVGDWRLNDCTLYVTKEPCPMCAGAAVHARLGRVVFGCPDAARRRGGRAAQPAPTSLAQPPLRGQPRGARRGVRAGAAGIFPRTARRRRAEKSP